MVIDHDIPGVIERIGLFNNGYESLDEFPDAVKASPGSGLVFAVKASPGIAVGTAVASRPPHGSVREVLPHTAPAASRARKRSFG